MVLGSSMGSKNGDVTTKASLSLNVNALGVESICTSLTTNIYYHDFTSRSW